MIHLIIKLSVFENCNKLGDSDNYFNTFSLSIGHSCFVSTALLKSDLTPSIFANIHLSIKDENEFFSQVLSF